MGILIIEGGIRMKRSLSELLRCPIIGAKLKEQFDKSELMELELTMEQNNKPIKIDTKSITWALCEHKGLIIVTDYPNAKSSGYVIHGISSNRAHLLELQRIRSNRELTKFNLKLVH